MTAQREMSLTLYIHSVKLINFKSIGDYPESEIIIEPRVTAIIGKNESGKSNVLDGISKIDFLKHNSAAFATENVNRNKPSGTENKYVITLKSTPDDITSSIAEDTYIEISKNKCIVSGGLLLYYNSEVYTLFESVINALDIINSNPFQLKDQDLVNYKTHRNEFIQKDELDIYRRYNSIGYFSARLEKIPADLRENLKDIPPLLSTARDAWLKLTGVLPKFYYRKTDKHLKATYKLDEVEKEFSNPSSEPNSLLNDLIKILDITPDNFKTAVQTGTSGPQESMRLKINRLVDNKINQPFHDFYQTEDITLNLSFSSGAVSFMIQ